jgi:hypothetical protein
MTVEFAAGMTVEFPKLRENENAHRVAAVGVCFRRWRGVMWSSRC